MHEFLSPISNRRTDRYGGSFENRIRLLLEGRDNSHHGEQKPDNGVRAVIVDQVNTEEGDTFNFKEISATVAIPASRGMRSANGT